MEYCPKCNNELKHGHMGYRECTCGYNNLCAFQKKVLTGGKLKEVGGIRKFDTGATRDSGNGKLEYEGYIHPLNDYSFAEYMKTKQVIGGEYRKGDNRTKGIPTSAIFPSLIRHIEVLKLLMKGIRVREYKENGEIKWSVGECSIEGAEEKYIIQELNAIRFNTEAMKLNYLTNNHHDVVEDQVEKQELIEQESVIFNYSFREEVKKQRYFTIQADPKDRICGGLIHKIYTYVGENVFVIRFTYEEGKPQTFTVVPTCYVENYLWKYLGCQTGLIEGVYAYDYERALDCYKRDNEDNNSNA